ncbi:hypothetical protein [Micromonospora sp. DT63]|uniref:hypothetical protein n=1 Tax=Micromonospora sp. DT63 TaxID=3393441 RepID=UPI003CE7EA89
MRRLSALVPLLLLSAAIASCSRATPLCDYADGLVKSAQLTQAADAYATAERSDEGDCADDGLKHVGELRAKASAYVAKGRAARRAGQLPAATASFRAALAIDHSDTEAAAELQGLTSVSATPALAPSVVPILVKGPPGRDAGRGLAWLALVLTLVVIIAALGLAMWIRATRLALDRVAASLDAAKSRDDDLRADVVRLIEAGRATTDDVEEWYGPGGDR